MTNHTIITIGRQFGSGGHEVGNRLSERLNIPLYDNNLISMAAHELSISQEAAEKVDETILGKFLSAYVVNMRDYTVFINDSNESVPLSDKVYEVQTSIINRLSERGPCIFVGRCADYILGDYSNCIHVFIHAFKEDRVRRISRIYKLNEKQAWDKIKRTDRERRMYYETHAGRPWGSIESHQILFNASLLGVDGIVDALEAIYRSRQK